MADLTTDFIGITSPNPFWLASAPPTDKEYNVRRAFEAGWGGVVWKTLGSEGPPVVNVNGPRYGAIYGADRRLLCISDLHLGKSERIARLGELIEPWFIFSMVWTIGATCDNDGRVKFDKWFREKCNDTGVRTSLSL